MLFLLIISVRRQAQEQHAHGIGPLDSIREPKPGQYLLTRPFRVLEELLPT